MVSSCSTDGQGNQEYVQSRADSIECSELETSTFTVKEFAEKLKTDEHQYDFHCVRIRGVVWINDPTAPHMTDTTQRYGQVLSPDFRLEIRPTRRNLEVLNGLQERVVTIEGVFMFSAEPSKPRFAPLRFSPWPSFGPIYNIELVSVDTIDSELPDVPFLEREVNRAGNPGGYSVLVTQR